MVLPTAVIKYLVDKLDTWKLTETNLSSGKEGSEDSSSEDLPNIIIYSDFDERAELDHKKAYPVKLPCSIYVMFFSEAFATPQESYNKAFLMALSFLKKYSAEPDFQVTNTNNVAENVHLKLQEMPIMDLRKSAAGSVIQLQFTYNVGV
jgi:hypothetical protein